MRHTVGVKRRGALRAALAVLCCAIPVLSQAPDAQELNRRGAQELAAGRVAEAVELLQHAYKLTANDPKIALNLGLAYVRTGRFRDAVQPLQQAVRDPESREKAGFLLGSAYYELGQFEKAVEQLEPLRSKPEYAENALYLLEESYRKARNGPGAERAFSDLLARYPDSALVHKLLGTAHDAQGQPKEALAEFEKAAHKDPSLPEVKFDAGLMSLKLHDEASAQRRFREELAINSCFAPALYYLGEIERWGDRYSTAAGWYRKALRCAPDYADAQLALGTVLQASGDNAGALRALRRAVELNPDKSEAHFQLARALAKAGHEADAQREMQKARNLASDRDAADKR